MLQTVIYLSFLDVPLEVRESLTTTKNRLFDNQPFMVVTDMRKKRVVINKAFITMIMAEEVVGGKKASKRVKK